MISWSAKLNKIIYIWRVKKAFKISFILFLAMLYGIVTSFVNTGALNSGLILEPGQETEHYYLNISANLICAATPAESPVHLINAFPFCSQKTSAEEYNGKVKMFGKLVSDHFIQYFSYNTNLFLHFRIPEFIFPIHYFW